MAGHKAGTAPRPISRLLAEVVRFPALLICYLFNKWMVVIMGFGFDNKNLVGNGPFAFINIDTTLRNNNMLNAKKNRKKIDWSLLNHMCDCHATKTRPVSSVSNADLLLSCVRWHENEAKLEEEDMISSGGQDTEHFKDCLQRKLLHCEYAKAIRNMLER